MTRPIIRPASPASYCSTLVECFHISGDGHETRLGHGTGFFYKAHNITFLITNWHVFSGRDPAKPEMTLPGYASSPTHIGLSLASKENPKHFLPLQKHALYDQQRMPLWLESPLGFSKCDIVAMPFHAPEGALIYATQDFTEDVTLIYQPGIDVCVIGFPFPRNQSNPFPIWKKAMIASEPAYLIDGKAMTYLDMPGRPGMSGSPVYYITDGIAVTKEQYDLLHAHPSKVSASDVIDQLDISQFSNPTKILKFAGVYSGSYGDENLAQLNLGRFWPALHVDEILKSLKRGENPYPPCND